MADLIPILDPKELKTNLLKRQPISIQYDKEFDDLLIYFDTP
jgi:hypothetical protein